MDRIFSFCFAAVLVVGAIACSSTSNTAEKPVEVREDSVAQDVNSVPDWFSKENVTFGDASVKAHATAIGSDAATAESKAVSRAEALLKQSVSGKLESIRSEAVHGLGKDSGLADPGFLIAFCKVDNAVGDIVSTQQTDTEGIDNQNGIRGFAEVELQKEELIERIDRRLASHEKAWNALKESKAFEVF